MEGVTGGGLYILYYSVDVVARVHTCMYRYIYTNRVIIPVRFIIVKSKKAPSVFSFSFFLHRLRPRVTTPPRAAAPTVRAVVYHHPSRARTQSYDNTAALLVRIILHSPMMAAAVYKHTRVVYNNNNNM